jgi:arginase
MDRVLLTPCFLDDRSPALEALAEPGWRINAPDLAPGRTTSRLRAVHEPIAAFVAECLAVGARPISIAGDCCAAIGMAAGLQRAGVEPTLVWLDAHGDFNTWETTPSGFLGGMPLAMLAGRGDQTMLDAVAARPVAESRIVLADARDLDPLEQDALAASDVAIVRDLRDLAAHPRLRGPLYVHFDTDIADPGDVPAMRYPAPGGPALGTLRDALGALAASGLIVAVSVSTWWPDLDADGRSRSTSLALLRTLLG